MCKGVFFSLLVDNALNVILQYSAFFHSLKAAVFAQAQRSLCVLLKSEAKQQRALADRTIIFAVEM